MDPWINEWGEKKEKGQGMKGNVTRVGGEKKGKGRREQRKTGMERWSRKNTVISIFVYLYFSGG